MIARDVGHARQLRVLVITVAAVAVLGAVGFYSSYLRHFPGFEGVGWQVHFHLLTVLAWIGMLVGQGWLAATRRLATHRKLGRLSFALVPLVLVGFVLITSYGQLRHKEPALLGATFLDASLFSTLYALAIAHRRNPGLHSRYMMLTPLSFLNPTLGRAVSPAFSVPFVLALFVGLFFLARRKGTPSRPYLVAALVYVGLTVIVVYVSVAQPGFLESLWKALWG
ncbi:MAG: hypothetical protein ACAI38_01605 [Myxococcota bacterium]|nr:hypothetical protein [Myxococcota bacterium]